MAAILTVVVAVIVVGAAARLLAEPLATRRLVRYLRTTENGVVVGPSRELRWADLVEVRVETTAGGPWVEDLFLVLVPRRGRAVRIPEPLVPVVMEAVMRLPGFDGDELLRAMTCAEDATFLCWRRPE